MARHRWLGAGVVTAGLSINLLSGAAVALARQDPRPIRAGRPRPVRHQGRTPVRRSDRWDAGGAESADPQSPDADSGGASESAADPDPSKIRSGRHDRPGVAAEEVDTDATTGTRTSRRASTNIRRCATVTQFMRDRGPTAAPETVAQSVDPVKAEPSESEAPDVPSTSARPADETVATRKDVAVLGLRAPRIRHRATGRRRHPPRRPL